MTQEDDMRQAYEMAWEALGLSLTTKEEAGETFPVSSSPDVVPSEDGFLAVIEFDIMEYRRKHCSRAVKRL